MDDQSNDAALLRSLGCTQAQGYYWARPMPAEEIEIFCELWEKNHPT